MGFLHTRQSKRKSKSNDLMLKTSCYVLALHSGLSRFMISSRKFTCFLNIQRELSSPCRFKSNFISALFLCNNQFSCSLSRSLSHSLSLSPISSEINCTSFPNRAISPPSVHRRKSGLVDANLLLPQTPPRED